MLKKQSKDQHESAWKSLYGNDWRDLSADGYTEAMSILRARDPNLARRVERQLDPFLSDKIFRHRKVNRFNSSQGLRARLVLLPDNPHVKEDISIVRKVLGIPTDQVKPTEYDPLWIDVALKVKPEAVKRVVQDIIAARWHIVHVQEAYGEQIEHNHKKDNGNLLSEPMFNTATASAHTSFIGESFPSWLQKPPSGSPPYDDSGAPLDRAVGRLIERHRLSWITALPLTFYILTEDSDYLNNIELLSLASSYSYYRPYENHTHSIMVTGIDEFITKADWMRLWQRYIVPMQRRLWAGRGMRPQGRRTTDIPRLNEFLPLYKKGLAKHLDVKDLLAGPQEDWDEDWWNIIDQKTIRRVIKDLEKLLLPLE